MDLHCGIHRRRHLCTSLLLALRDFRRRRCTSLPPPVPPFLHSVPILFLPGHACTIAGRIMLQQQGANVPIQAPASCLQDDSGKCTRLFTRCSACGCACGQKATDCRFCFVINTGTKHVSRDEYLQQQERLQTPGTGQAVRSVGVSHNGERS
jgi:hypothetical protein